MMSTNSVQNENIAPVWEGQLRIHSKALRMGYYVASLDIEWDKTPFPFQGVLLSNLKQMSWIQENCQWVVVDVDRSKTKSAPRKLTNATLADSGGQINRDSIKTALKSYVGLERDITEVIQNLRSGQFVSTDRMKESINTIANQLFDHGPALIWLTHIKTKDNYTAEHCLNVAILAMGLAHSLGWSRKDIRDAGMAGLLHDVGKTLVPSRILNKPGALTNEEFELMKLHTTKGFQIISNDQDISMDVKMAALHHHERADGTGYPHQLSAHEIPDIAALVSVVDAYDAITSNRVYQNARNHHLALGILWKGRKTQFNEIMVEAFIRWIGWVSPGSVVKLTTDEMAIVISSNSENRLQPTVRMLIENDGTHLLGPIKQLSNLTNGDGNPVHISKVIDSSESKVDMKELARQMLFSKVH